ncbi:uncharacterized protein N7511_005863 [Penicillium nucicola]|uniref:uncharacterized protein n=1 Tax=Penicillium nucicola TaxID=1850975 RepID=UPI0025455EE2|nr:uncharacterized protein N7511_005863 [Penicillium nucicola]KAJ5762481.1 hypothetical protein N7511_005863 [Penicillium nucicola]
MQNGCEPKTRSPDPQVMAVQNFVDNYDSMLPDEQARKVNGIGGARPIPSPIGTDGFGPEAGNMLTVIGP